MKYCKKCIMPATRPEQVFGQDGVCDACRSVERKKEIDWSARDREFREILDRYRSPTGWYDCIIPVSGGKDSVFQALTMRDRYGMNPLCVNHIPCEITEVGQQNITFMRELGFDMIQVGANRKAYREMVRIGFQKLGDCCWPEHIGIFTAPVRVAVQYRVPLLIWGENSQFEYGGPAAKKDNHYLDRNWLEQFQMLGYRINDVVNDGIKLNDIKTFHYPTDAEIRDVGVTGLFMGHFLKWDTAQNIEAALSLGWSPNPEGPVENAWNAYENLDCKWIGGLHDYMKFIKYGYSRATDQLCIEIRHGRMTRDQAIDALMQSSEGKVPWRYIPDFLDYLGLQKGEFLATLDRFTNKRIFECDSKGILARDPDGNLIPKFKPKKSA